MGREATYYDGDGRRRTGPGVPWIRAKGEVRSVGELPLRARLARGGREQRDRESRRTAIGQVVLWPGHNYYV